MVPDYREIELTLHRQTIVDQVAAFLYAVGIVRDDEEVIDIDFIRVISEINDGRKVVPMTIKLKKHQETEVFKH